MIKQTLHASIILALAAAAVPASAQPPMGMGDSMMNHQIRMAEQTARFDSNGDGRVTREEMQAARAEAFRQGDSDANGALSLAELQTLQAKRKEERLAAGYAYLDSDSDGAITAAEFVNGRPGGTETATTALFNLTDSDDSGTLSFDEFAVLHSKTGRLWRHFTSQDANGNGQIEEAEFSAAPHRGFKGGHSRHRGGHPRHRGGFRR
ncbi:MAG: hypothetical protein GY862_26750 [Gammaproteobacteria bacterium]|nr:hypothetical protein [Gammaproteobacteria bacterium]